MRTALAILALAVSLSSLSFAGCTSTCLDPSGETSLLENLQHESGPADPIPEHSSLLNDIPIVRTVLDPDAPPRPISLRECIALALESGRNSTGNIRVLAYDPAQTATTIEQALSRFDAQWQTNMSWTTTDQPNVIPSQALQAALFGVPLATSEQQAQFQSQLYKPLATGGVAGITFQVPYLITNNVFSLYQLTQPSYSPSLQFSFEQPLLQGAGVAINQVRDNHPGSILTSLFTTGQGVGILVARVNFDQARSQFEQQLQDLLATVETAYWNLYGSYTILYAREEILKLSLLSLQRARKLYEAQQFTLQDLTQMEAQYHAFRAQRLQALGQGNGFPGVLQAERRLRQAIGLPPEDGTRLVPLDPPTEAPLRPDWRSSLAEALILRPELVQARQQVKLADLQLKKYKDTLLPDLRFTSTYNLNSIGTQLDGSSDANALGNLAANQYNNWSLGLQMQVPIGRRQAYAQIQSAKLQLVQNLAALRDTENVVVFSLQENYRQLIESHAAILIQHAQLNAAQRQLQARMQEFQLGQGIVLNLLSAQQSWASAQEQLQRAVCAYNVTLINWERQKGSIMQYDNVTIAEGPLPLGALEQASAAIRKRRQGLVLRRRPAEIMPFSELPFPPAAKTTELPSCPDKGPEPIEQLPLPQSLPEEQLPLPKVLPPAQSLPDKQSPLPEVIPPPEARIPAIVDEQMKWHPPRRKKQEEPNAESTLTPDRPTP